MKRWIHSKTKILGMVTDRSKIIQHLRNFSDRIEEHLAKCVMYGNQFDCYNHWIDDELATWISDANEFISEPKGKKLSADDYRWNLFGGIGDEMSDMRPFLHSQMLANIKSKEPFPEVDVNDEMCKRMFDVSKSIDSKIVPILTTKNELNKQDFKGLLHSILDPICL